MKVLMIVDDQECIREALNLYFSNDYEIIEAMSGKDAALKFENNKVDAIISDLQMPDGDGFWLLDFLK